MFFFFLMIRRPPRSTLFPYTTALPICLLYDFIERHRDGIQAEQDIPNVRRRNVMHLARSCQYDAVHAHHVAKDRKSTRLNSSHLVISYAVFCLKKKD